MSCNCRAITFGSEPYFSVSHANNNSHFLNPNQQGKKHHPRPKPKRTSPYLYAK